MTSNHVKMWYAMSASYGREQMAVELLDKESDVATYVPMERYELMVGRMKKERKICERPVVRNLLFVQAPLTISQPPT